MRRYRIVRELGSGGMGTVYEGRMLLPFKQELPVAIKLIRKDHARDERYVAMFAQEALTTLRINHNHPNLVTTYDFGMSAASRPFLVMELVAGASLRSVAQAVPVPWPAVRRIACDALSGLSYLHGQGVVHRDVSPGNILLARDGTVKLADFGLIKRTGGPHSGAFRGTAAYASPEALEGLELTPQSDMYSLAAVLYELIVGEPPFGAGEPVQVYGNMARHQPPPLPALTPPDLSEFITGQINPRADERAFVSAGVALEGLRRSIEPVAGAAEMRELVDEWSRHQPPESRETTRSDTLVSLAAAVIDDHLDDRAASSESVSPPPKPPARRRRLGMLAALTAVALAGVCGVYTARRAAPVATAPTAPTERPPGETASVRPGPAEVDAGVAAAPAGEERAPLLRRSRKAPPQAPSRAAHRPAPRPAPAFPARPERPAASPGNPGSDHFAPVPGQGTVRIETTSPREAQ